MENDAELLEKVPPLLLRWYDACARVLPWRSVPTPYRVWVSEIMLQQTRVEAAKPYFERFLQALPTVEALANAPEDRLLKLWEGLGYYSRARNLQKGARQVMERFGGEIPGDVKALRSLPGIGGYTAGAIASIAFGLPEPAVDGNVLRVVSRLLARRDDVLDLRVKRRMEEELRAVLPPNRPGDFNQALMDLGATVCLPNSRPQCESCPLAGLCRAHAAGQEETLPVKAAKKARRVEERTVFLLICRGKLALRRRPDKGLLAGLWGLPEAEGRLGEEAALQLLAGWGCAGGLVPAPAARHIFTHVEWRMTGWQTELEKEAEGFVWADPAQLAEEYPLPTAYRAYAGYFLSQYPRENGNGRGTAGKIQ